MVSLGHLQLGGDCSQPIADHRGAALQHLELAAGRADGLDVAVATTVLALLVVQVRELVPRVVESGHLGREVLVAALKALGLEDSRETPAGDVREIGLGEAAGLARRRALAEGQQATPHWA